MLPLLSWIGVTLLAAIGGAVTAKEAARFYATLAKPPWAPPAWLFGPAWTLLYVTMGVAAWMVWRDHGFANASGALILYGVQLVFNAAWSWFFFIRKHGQWATIEAALLWVAVVATHLAFYQKNHTAALLLLPYIAWVTFATALSYSVWQRNPVALGGSAR